VFCKANFIAAVVIVIIYLISHKCSNIYNIKVLHTHTLMVIVNSTIRQTAYEYSHSTVQSVV